MRKPVSRGVRPWVKGECVWISYYNEAKELRFVITSKETSRDYYFLYEIVDGEFNKLGRAKSPKELEEKFGVNKALGGGT